MIHVHFQLHATSNMVSSWYIKLILYVPSTAGTKRSHANKSTLIDITRVLLNIHQTLDLLYAMYLRT